MEIAGTREIAGIARDCHERRYSPGFFRPSDPGDSAAIPRDCGDLKN